MYHLLPAECHIRILRLHYPLRQALSFFTGIHRKLLCFQSIIRIGKGGVSYSFMTI